MKIDVFEQMHSPPEYRWAACYGQYDDGSVCGLGPTPEAAKVDLITNYDAPCTGVAMTDGYTTHNSVAARPQPTEDQMLLDESMALLHRFALEQIGWRGFFKRWYYSDEPLRHDAANLVRRAGCQRMRPEYTRLVGDGRWA